MKGRAYDQNFWFRIENFLSRSDWETLHAELLKYDGGFGQDADHKSVHQYRKSRLLLTEGGVLPEPYRSKFRRKFDVIWPVASESIGYPEQPRDFSQQIVASYDGDFFKQHRDSTTFSGLRAGVSYVFYAHREPRRFTGGELVFYDSAGEVRQTVEPLGNSLILFRGNLLHEISSVNGPKELCDARLTVNGFVNRVVNLDSRKELRLTEDSVLRMVPGLELRTGQAGLTSIVDPCGGSEMELPVRAAGLLLRALDGVTPTRGVCDSLNLPLAARGSVMGLLQTLFEAGAVEEPDATLPPR